MLIIYSLRQAQFFGIFTLLKLHVQFQPQLQSPLWRFKRKFQREVGTMHAGVFFMSTDCESITVKFNSKKRGQYSHSKMQLYIHMETSQHFWRSGSATPDYLEITTCRPPRVGSILVSASYFKRQPGPFMATVQSLNSLPTFIFTF